MKGITQQAYQSITQPSYSTETVDAWNKRFAELREWADKTGVPMPVQEASMRDFLGAVEALRLAPTLKMYL